MKTNYKCGHVFVLYAYYFRLVAYICCFISYSGRDVYK